MEGVRGVLNRGSVGLAVASGPSPACPAIQTYSIHTTYNLPQQQASQALSFWATPNFPVYGLGSYKDVILQAEPTPPSGSQHMMQLKATLRHCPQACICISVYTRLRCPH